MSKAAFIEALRGRTGAAMLTPHELEALYEAIVSGDTAVAIARRRWRGVSTVEAQLAKAAIRLGFAHVRTMRHALTIAYGRALERLGVGSDAGLGGD